MFTRPRSARLIALLAFTLLATPGCDRASRMPTSATPHQDDPVTAAPTRGADDTGAQDVTPRRAGRWPYHAVIPEAREALGAILTGEQVYYQMFATFTDAADTSEIRTVLSVHLEEPSRRWAFSVSGASATGFIATARGREGTEAQGFIVTLNYVRDRPPEWNVRVHPNRRR